MPITHCPTCNEYIDLDENLEGWDFKTNQCTECKEREEE
jgi:hypothetical protein